MTGYQQNKRKQVKMTNLPLVILKVAIPAMLVLVIPSLRLSAYYQNCGPIVWNVGSPIQANIVAPVSGQGVCPDTLVLCHASASDVDHWGNACSSGNQDDIVNSYTWSATGGSFPNGNMGSLVYWKAPCTPGNVTITCSFDDLGNAPLPPESGTRDDLSVERTVTVTVLEPIQELSLLSPSGTIGGGVPIRLQVRTRCSSCETPDIRHKEGYSHYNWCDICGSDWCFVTSGCADYGGTTSETVDGITTTILEYGWDTVFDHIHGGWLHNGEHTLRATMKFTDTCNQTVVREVNQSVNINNLLVSASPDYIVWKSDSDPVPITVSISDNDNTKPMHIILTISSTDSQTAGSWTMEKTDVTGDTVVFEWDGSLTAFGLTSTASPGTYRYLVNVSQDDCNDGDRDKSDWEITSTSAEIVDYNEINDKVKMRVGYTITPPLPCTEVTASQAKLEVYDPDMEKIYEATMSGNIPVCQNNFFPDFEMSFNKGGNYVFLVSATDGSPPFGREYVQYWDKAHRNKPMLQRNKIFICRDVMVFLDAGHGGIDGGTPGYYTNNCTVDRYAWAEREAVEWVRSELANELANHCIRPHPGLEPWECALIRYKIKYVPREIGSKGREKRANWVETELETDKPKYAVFISLHCNAGNTHCTTVRSTQAWYHPDIKDSSTMAQALISNLENIDGSHSPPINRVYTTNNAKNNKRQTLLRALANNKKQYTHQIPCNLVELVMLTTPEDEALIAAEWMHLFFAKFIHMTYCYFDFKPVSYKK